MRVQEGMVEIEAPEQPEEGTGAAVFFNPDQELNRDLTIAALRAYRERDSRAETYLDATAATGIRGVRAAADGWTVTCCDADPDAADLCEHNLARNALDGTVVHRDVNALLHESAFDVVDLDPFGTPIPFVDAAVQGTRDLLCVTATDTGPLCGAHFDAGVRRYGAVPRNTEYHAEMGVRVLLSALVRTAARYDVAAWPVMTHASDHYVRTYLEFERGASPANDAIGELGFVSHCQACLYRTADRGLIADAPDRCPNCGEPIQTAGPIWLGSIQEVAFVERARERLSSEFGTADRARSLLTVLAAELDEPTHYDQHQLCKRWGRSAGPMDAFLAAIRDAGYPASRTHFGGTTFKTTADVEAIRSAISADPG